MPRGSDLALFFWDWSQSENLFDIKLSYKSTDEKDKVWGVAYEIDDQEWKNSVMAHLDHREKGGYTQHSVQFYPRQAENGMPSEGVTGMIFKRNFN